MLAQLEKRHPRTTPATPPICAIILGGGINTRLSAQRGTYIFTRAADRYIEALRLARLYPDMQLLVTGGDNSLSGNIHGEAEPAAHFFADHGIAQNRLIYEPRARNTAENASYTAALLKTMVITTPCLLVTSAYHMPRSVIFFKRAKVTVTPWPVDYRTDGTQRLHLSFGQPLTNAAMLSTALREWAGLLSQRVINTRNKPVQNEKN